ncbi:MAG: hypothetical protein ACKVQK_21735 [Burkholderiales bacterium]
MNARDQNTPLSDTHDTPDKSLHPVNVAFADYDRTRPLIDGRVQAPGIKLSIDTKFIAEFCARPVYEEYDAAEMSFSWFVAARARGEPVIALPVFPLRMPVLAYVLCRNGASFTKPSDLIGKRIGVARYRYTVNLWLRGIFKEHYGLAPEQVTWVTSGEEDAGYVPPQGIHIELNAGRLSTQALLARGEVDAVLLARLPDDYLRGETDFRRLFPDARAEMRAYYAKTGIVPITHVMVMGQALYDREPWIAANLTQAFIDAQRMCDDFYLDCSKHLSYPEAVFFMEEQRETYGAYPWSHGIDGNRQNIDTFVRYAQEQQYIPRVLTIEEMFATNTLALKR